MKHTCYFCHGTVGQGASVTGARIAVVARNLQGFTRYVRQPAGQMPAYTDKILSDQELADMFAYLRALPPAKPAREIPLLEQLKAKRVTTMGTQSTQRPQRASAADLATGGTSAR